MKIDKNKIFDGIFLVLIFVLYLFVIVFYSFVIRASFALKKWPSYNNPDPALLHFDAHQEVVINCLSFSIISIILILPLFIISKLTGVKLKKKYWILCLIGICLNLYILAVDPFMEWFAD